MTDEALGGIARLLRRYHEVAGSVRLRGAPWSKELADPREGTTSCAICPENVVFRSGKAVAMLDFDYAAPGRLAWDMARTIRM